MRTVFIQLFLLIFTLSHAQALERFDIITTKELHALITQRGEGKIHFLLVNTLDTLIAGHHSIPGSINIPWSEITERAGELGRDKEKLIITYCMGYR